MRFADGKALGERTSRILEMYASPQNGLLNRPRARPAIVAPLRARHAGTVDAYVRESARRLLPGLTPGVEATGDALALAELPDGFTLLHGDATDAIAYEYPATRAAK